MTAFYIGDRVVVQGNGYRKEHGKISSEMLVGLLRNKYRVTLDNGKDDEFFIADIKHEDLPDGEISEVIKHIQNEVKRFSSKLPETMKTELPNHIGYLKDALLSKDKSRAESEYAYVKKNIPSDETESTRIDFEKIDWAVNRLS
ncbi:MAG: hypothetical protein QNJ63_21655 [Calothrix sp. MO_192.B10]|nr:hypothetical protein [Calothrix sp. MO_192.B10]